MLSNEYGGSQNVRLTPELRSGVHLGAALVLIECAVGCFEKSLELSPVACCFQPAENSTWTGLAGNFGLAADEAFEHALELVAVAFGKKNHEFVAPEAYREIGAANGPGDMLGESPQNNITAGVAVGIIDLLEAVKVEQEHGKWRAFALTAGNLRFDAGLRETPVVQAGQRVEHGHSVERLGTGLLALNFIAKILDVKLLPERVAAEHENQTDEDADGDVQVHPYEGLLFTQQRRQGERDDGTSEQQDDDNGVRPGPPVAVLNLAQV